MKRNADVAQSVVRRIGSAEVTGPIPVISSIKRKWEALEVQGFPLLISGNYLEGIMEQNLRLESGLGIGCRHLCLFFVIPAFVPAAHVCAVHTVGLNPDYCRVAVNIELVICGGLSVQVKVIIDIERVGVLINLTADYSDRKSVV